ncbi:general secretion pathway protein GspL [Pseudomonas amygdali pv. mori str. 301020]|uniref:General secretion pathway protein GspL n=1 Tax=Pseudomonas amygdali pv. mori str. 301020 TaxID=629261 RepID=A0A656GBC0_PSEA0|nr:general secretion pathway protein GspL [Pseudomonas amygdali pv. mori str. 301020]
MSRLRIALPALEQLNPETPLLFVRLDSQGKTVESGLSNLLELKQGGALQPVEAFLHPLDSLLARIETPPLTASRIRSAALLAAQGLILGGSELMHIASSPRYSDGAVYLGWLPATALERLSRLLSQSRLSLRGLYPAPYGLPVPAPGQVSVVLRDEHWLLRHGAGQGGVHPRLTETPDARLANGSELHRLDDEGTAGLETSAVLLLGGPSPGWSLHAGIGAAKVRTSGWPAIWVCCGLAVGVWALGLNLYAAREAARGQQLRAGMVQRVSQAFPYLPVILNPLQQARQQVAALESGSATGTDSGFEQLVKSAAGALPFLAGSVQRLTYSDGRLQLQLLPDNAQPAVDDTLQRSLAQVGLTASRDHLTWTLSQMPDQAADASASTPESDVE